VEAEDEEAGGGQRWLKATVLGAAKAKAAGDEEDDNRRRGRRGSGAKEGEAEKAKERDVDGDDGESAAEALHRAATVGGVLQRHCLDAWKTFWRSDAERGETIARPETDPTGLARFVAAVAGLPAGWLPTRGSVWRRCGAMSDEDVDIYGDIEADSPTKPKASVRAEPARRGRCRDAAAADAHACAGTGRERDAGRRRRGRRRGGRPRRRARGRGHLRRRRAGHARAGQRGGAGRSQRTHPGRPAGPGQPPGCHRGR